MTENPFAAELQRRRLARSATITPEKRIRALELFAVSPDGHRLEALRKISAPLADWSERKHEANLEAKAKAWDLAEQKERSTAVPIESDAPSTGSGPKSRDASSDVLPAVQKCIFPTGSPQAVAGSVMLVSH